MPLNILVYGCKGYGKTRTAEKLASHFIDLGYKVIYIKHIHHGDYKVDYDRKDTGRLLNVGVSAVAAISDTRIYINSIDEHALLKSFLREFLERFDVAIYEGVVDIDTPTFDIVINIVGEDCRREVPYPYKEYIEVSRANLDNQLEMVIREIKSRYLV